MPDWGGPIFCILRFHKTRGTILCWQSLAALSRLLAQAQVEWTKAFGRACRFHESARSNRMAGALVPSSRVSQRAQQASVWRWRSWSILFSSSSPNGRLVVSLALPFIPTHRSLHSLSGFIKTAVSRLSLLSTGFFVTWFSSWDSCDPPDRLRPALPFDTFPTPTPDSIGHPLALSSSRFKHLSPDTQLPSLHLTVPPP